MTSHLVGSSKGQMKIQQMAFMLVAVMIFFSLVALVYFSFTISNLKKDTIRIRDSEAREMVRKISSTPELAFTSGPDCSACIDLDKALMLKESTKFRELWNLDYLAIERVYPVQNSGECTRPAYPDRCNMLTILDSPEKYGAASEAFVNLVRWDKDLGSFRYELGKIYASGENLNE